MTKQGWGELLKHAAQVNTFELPFLDKMDPKTLSVSNFDQRH